MVLAYRFRFLVVSSLLGCAACGRVGYDPLDAAIGDASVPCAPDEIACGGFEGPLGGWSVRIEPQSDGIVRVVDDPERGGALAITSEGGGPGLAVAETYFEPVIEGSLHGRVWLRVGARTEIDEFVVAVQLDDGNDDGTQKVSLDLLSGDALGLTATTAHPAVRNGAAPGTIRRDEWMCLRFEVDLRDDGGAARLSEGMQPLASAESIDTIPDGGFRRLMLGAVGPSAGVRDVLFDDVALARHPLPCQSGPRR
ncbi:hypothetical protein [Sandaracinus amylolyticus]|uniref:hypothetical protein n=1 Tax=Sandaracinus amylolyticus TaxID=927083 RepID=UPI001F2E09DA|nr:hypothetical protein [Sandaracinus amylolyticus]UJR86368.1 Hypothetical protein I5071_84620 [Sandaracinus amylolyticus]